MPLHSLVLNSVVTIRSAGDFQGSGFIVYMASETVEGHMWPYLVTAHHVVRGHDGLIEIDVPDPRIIGESTKGVPVRDWVQPVPKVDLAIAPFPTDLVERYQGFMFDHFMPHGSGIGLGGQILYVGIFEPENAPMARSGYVGAVGVPITTHDEFGHVQYRYDGDLLDCRSYKGFSGSPCLAQMTYAVLDSDPELPAPLWPKHDDCSPVDLRNVATVAGFCGIITRHYGDETASDADGAVSRFGVCVMLSSDYVRLGLTAPGVVKQRRRWDEQLRKKSGSEP